MYCCTDQHLRCMLLGKIYIGNIYSWMLIRCNDVSSFYCNLSKTVKTVCSQIFVTQINQSVKHLMIPMYHLQSLFGVQMLVTITIHEKKTNAHFQCLVFKCSSVLLFLYDRVNLSVHCHNSGHKTVTHKKINGGPFKYINN